MATAIDTPEQPYGADPAEPMGTVWRQDDETRVSVLSWSLRLSSVNLFTRRKDGRIVLVRNTEGDFDAWLPDLAESGKVEDYMRRHGLGFTPAPSWAGLSLPSG
jgi:hypothetical protein